MLCSAFVIQLMRKILCWHPSTVEFWTAQLVQFVCRSWSRGGRSEVVCVASASFQQVQPSLLSMETTYSEDLEGRLTRVDRLSVRKTIIILRGADDTTPLWSNWCRTAWELQNWQVISCTLGVSWPQDCFRIVGYTMIIYITK